MQIQIDNRDNNIVYTGLQFGNYYRLDLSNNEEKVLNLNISLETLLKIQLANTYINISS